MKLIKYTTFASSEAFEEWQKDKEPNICAISPIVDEAHVDELAAGLTLTPKVGIFVTYVTEEKESS